MNIAVVDVAAQEGGSGAVLRDYVDYIKSDVASANHQWFVFTSLINFSDSNNVHCIQDGSIKKSLLRRIYWENIIFPKLMKKYNIDVVVSLQNNALPHVSCKQIVFFHNILLLLKPNTFSFFKREERLLALYTHIIGPYTRHTWKRAYAFAVQTNTVKEDLLKFLKDGVSVVVIPPHVSLEGLECINSTSSIQGLIYPATTMPYKHIEDVIKLLHGKINKDIIFTFDGTENSYAQKLKKLAEGDAHFRFVGYMNHKELLEFYAKLNYGLLMVSEMETLGIPLIEARSFGVPIVAVDRPYVHESLKDYPNVEYVDVGFNNLSELVNKAFKKQKIDSDIISFESSWAKMNELFNVV